LAKKTLPEVISERFSIKIGQQRASQRRFLTISALISRIPALPALGN
jgi:hypothetical protein